MDQMLPIWVICLPMPIVLIKILSDWDVSNVSMMTNMFNNTAFSDQNQCY